MFLEKYFPPSMVTKLRNEITNFRQRPNESLFEAWERYKLLINQCPNHNMLPITQIDTFYNGLTLRHRDTINAAAGGTFMKRRFNQNQNRNNQNQNFHNQNRNQGNNHHPQGNNQGRNQFFQGASHGQNPPSAYRAPAYQDLGYQDPIHQPLIPQPQVVTTNEFTNYMKANDAILKNMQTNVTSLTNSNLKLKNMFGQFMKMNTASSSSSGTLPSNTITNLKEDLKSITTQSGTAYQGPTIPTTSSSLPPVVECETEQEKLGDPGKFLIPCDFLGMDECLALANLGASINLMPLSVCNKLSLPELSPMCMTLKLIDRLISHPVGVAEDVYLKVGTFHFPADFVVVDFDADPRVPLILERSFLKTGRALIDVFEGALTLRVFARISWFLRCNHEWQSHSLLWPDRFYLFSDSNSSPTLTPFGESDFLLEEVDAFLALEDDPTSSEVDQSYFDPDGDILLLEAFLNDDPSLPPPNQENYLPQDLPTHLEYAFLEVDDKLPVIIVKDLRNEEKTAFITVLKSYKRAITWKLFDIKGINPEFCTHKILIEEDFKPAVQHQRRVNPKIYNVIKKEVEKLLDAGLIYPISDSPWVSLVHCVPKKGGFTVVENEENELIPTRLVTGWRVCIDYQKLNEAAHKDHFPLPFMDQMLERLAGNEYYCFLDDFSGYFQIPIDSKDQEKTTFMCPYRMFAYRRMPFGLCNALSTFQRKPLTFSKLTTMDPPGDIMARTALPRRMKCLKIPSKFVRFLTYGASTSWVRSRLLKGTYILVAVDYLSKWVEAKALPTNDTHEKTKRLHDSKIKDRVFNIGDRVLLFNSRLNIILGKLKSRWSGPFTITHVFPYGTVELSQPDGPNFKVNDHRLKYYFGEDIPKMVVPDLQTFPKDQ
nr:DNA-directed DNA polymerase [Tanacetum cinerariifolium]